MQQAAASVSYPLKLSVSDERVERLLTEFLYALKKLPREEVAKLVSTVPLDFVAAVWRRGVNLGSLAKVIGVSVSDETSQFIEAWQQDRVGNHLGQKIAKSKDWATSKIDTGKEVALKIHADPYTEGLKLAAFAVVVLASSGGLEGDGGISDIDIPLLGIGAHRSPFTHSVLIGAGIEALIAGFIRTTLAISEKLPENHDPVWTVLNKNTSALLDAVSRGASLGISYHLLVDGLLQPAPYHGLPISVPLEVHQVILAANGVAEGLDGLKRSQIVARTDKIEAQHLQLLKLEFDIDPILIEWLGPDYTEILERQGAWMMALTTGHVPPISEKQSHFIQSAWQLIDAQTPAEKAWRAYVNLIRVAVLFQNSESAMDRAFDWTRSFIKKIV